MSSDADRPKQMTETDKLLKELRELVSENKKVMLKSGITDGFGREMTPRMLERSEEDFYKGCGTEAGREYRPQTSNRWKTKPLKENFVTFEDLFQPIYEEDGEDEVLRQSNVEDERLLRVTVVGEAGSGKTTILSRFARDATEGKVSQIQDKDRFVHFVNCKDFDANRISYVWDFLFDHMARKPSNEAIRTGYEWMVQNSEKVTFIIDSLDKLKFDLENETEEIGPYDSAPPATILFNILTGVLFNKSRVLTSSRAHKMMNYGDDLRPDKIIEMAGLNRESVRRITIDLLERQEGERILRILKECPKLEDLCENPEFLLLTLSSLTQSKGESAFVPNTMSGVLIKMLDSLVSSKRGKLKGYHTIAAIDKMKALSFKGIMDGRVLFTAKDLHGVNLTQEEVTNLAITVPGRESESHQMLESGAITSFSHQSLQEELCSLKVVEKDIEDFSAFVSEYFHQPKYSAIRRLVCGILLDSNVFQKASRFLLKVGNDVEGKKAVLRKSLVKQFQSGLAGRDLLELLHTIHESQDGAREIFPGIIDSIMLLGERLTASDCQALATSIRHCPHVDSLVLANCKLSPESLQILSKNLQNSTVQVREMQISLNTEMGVQGLQSVGQISRLCGVDELEVIGCDLTNEEINSFNEGLGDAKVNVINMSGNRFTNRDYRLPVAAICKLLENVAGHLNISFHKLGEEDVASLQRKLDEIYSAELRITIGPFGNERTLTAKKRDEGDVVYEAFSEDMDAAGGTVRVGGCRITFPPGSFSGMTRVRGKAEIDRKKWPNGYIAITSMLFLDEGNRLHAPATVQMSSWVIRGAKDTEAHVLHFCERTSTWEVIKRIPVSSDPLFQFECLNFSPIVVAIREELADSQAVLIEGGVYASDQNTFTLAFHCRDDLWKKRLQEDMNELNSKLQIKFSHLQTKVNETLQATLTCVRPENYLQDSLVLVVPVNRSFKKGSIVRRTALLHKRNEAPDVSFLTMSSHVEKSGKKIDGPHTFPHIWKYFSEDDSVLNQNQGRNEVTESKPCNEPSISNGQPCGGYTTREAPAIHRVHGGHLNATYINSVIAVINDSRPDQAAVCVERMNELKHKLSNTNSCGEISSQRLQSLEYKTERDKDEDVDDEPPSKKTNPGSFRD